MYQNKLTVKTKVKEAEPKVKKAETNIKEAEPEKDRNKLFSGIVYFMALFVKFISYLFNKITSTL